MFKLCNYIKDDGSVCNSPAKRHHHYCHHHHELLMRERRKSRARRRSIQAIIKHVSPFSLPSLQNAMECLKDGVARGRLDPKEVQLAVSALRLMAGNLRFMAKHPEHRPSLRDTGQLAHSLSRR